MSSQTISSETRGRYGCGFRIGDTVRVKHGRKRWRVVNDDDVGVRTGKVYLTIRNRQGSEAMRSADALVLLRKVAA